MSVPPEHGGGGGLIMYTHTQGENFPPNSKVKLLLPLPKLKSLRALTRERSGGSVVLCSRFKSLPRVNLSSNTKRLSRGPAVRERRGKKIETLYLWREGEGREGHNAQHGGKQTAESASSSPYAVTFESVNYM